MNMRTHTGTHAQTFSPQSIAKPNEHTRLRERTHTELKIETQKHATMSNDCSCLLAHTAYISRDNETTFLPI
jgi:hypothetical protein